MLYRQLHPINTIQSTFQQRKGIKPWRSCEIYPPSLRRTGFHSYPSGCKSRHWVEYRRLQQMFIYTTGNSIKVFNWKTVHVSLEINPNQLITSSYIIMLSVIFSLYIRYSTILAYCTDNRVISLCHFYTVPQRRIEPRAS